MPIVRRVLTQFMRVDTAPPHIPAGEHPDVFRASSKHLTYLLVRWAIGTVVLSSLIVLPCTVCLVLLAAVPHFNAVAWILGTVLVGALGCFALFSYASVRLDWEVRFYVLTDRALRIREGIVGMRELTLTLQNVQEVSVSQGPLQRWLGLCDVTIDTAGGGGSGGADAGAGSVHGHRGVLCGIDTAQGARDVRAIVQQRVRAQRSAGLGDGDTATTTSALMDSASMDALAAVRDEVRALRALPLWTTSPPTWQRRL